MASEAQSIKVGQMEINYLVDGTETKGIGVFELVVPGGANVPPPHSHTNNEEFILVTEGTLRYRVDRDARDLKRGDWMLTPRGSVHAFSNPHAETARAITILNPDIGPQYFREVGAVVNAGGPPDRAKLIEVMRAYGLVLAPPPQAQ